MIQNILDTAQETGAGAIHTLTASSAKAVYGVAQVEITDTATCKIQGRLQPDAPWVDAAEFTESGAKVVVLFPEMRANVTAYTSGDVNAWLKG